LHAVKNPVLLARAFARALEWAPDKVRVNAEDATLRANRLRLLNRIRQVTLAVADFSKIGG